MSRKIKQILCLCLSVILLLSTCMTSLATVVNGTGDGSASGTSTPLIVGSFLKLHANQGIRFSIINSQGTVVSNIVDICNYFPEDISGAVGTTGEDNYGLWKNYQNNSGSNVGTPKQNITYLGGGKTDLIYSLCTRKLEKTENKGGLKSLARANGDYSLSTSDFINKYGTNGTYLFKDGKMYTYELLYRMLTHDASLVGYENPLTGETGTVTYTATDGTVRTVPKYIMSPVQEGNIATGVDGLLGTGETLKNQLMIPITWKNPDGTDKQATLLQRILEMGAYDVDGSGHLKSSELVRMFEFYDSSLKAEYEKLVAEGETMPMSTVFKNNGLRILIEPVHWCYVPVINPTDLKSDYNSIMDATWSTTDCIYGTITEAYIYTLLLFYNAKVGNEKYKDMPSYSNVSAFSDWIDTHGIGVDWDWGLADEGYRLAEDQSDLGLKAYDKETEDTLSNFYANYNTSGFGVMVTSIDEEESATPTWDSTTYPSTNYKPGPSPENTNPDGTFPTTYPTEGTSYGTKDHKFNIIKYYGIKDGSGSIRYTQNYVRNETIHSININDEPGYTVNSWFTSSVYKEPASQTESYIDVKNSITKGGQEGDKAQRITISPKSTDTTLYVSLVESQKLIKVYETSGTVDKITVEVPNIINKTYTVTSPDNGYEYSEGTTSENGYTSISRWDEAPKTNSTTSKTISVPDEIKTIYLHYEKSGPDGGLVLHENEITHNFESLSLVDGTLHEVVRNYNSVQAQKPVFLLPEKVHC